MRPSAVGPRELKEETVELLLTAPTARIPSASAGATKLLLPAEP